MNGESFEMRTNDDGTVNFLTKSVLHPSDLLLFTSVSILSIKSSISLGPLAIGHCTGTRHHRNLVFKMSAHPTPTPTTTTTQAQARRLLSSDAHDAFLALKMNGVLQLEAESNASLPVCKLIFNITKGRLLPSITTSPWPTITTTTTTAQLEASTTPITTPADSGLHDLNSCDQSEPN